MRKVFLAATLAGIAVPAMAQTPATTSSPPPTSTLVATISGWEIRDLRGMCDASTAFEGQITALITYDFGNNTAWFYLASPAWESVRDGQSYNVSLRFSNGSTYDDARAEGVRSDTPNSRVTALQMQLMGNEFMRDFADSAGVAITMGEVRLAILSLRGTRAVAQRLSQCSATGFRRYPPDPFRNVPAPTTPSTSGSRVEPARARANLASYVSDADYPVSAIRAREEGTVSFSLLIGTDGRVANCVVMGSSGSAALDAATCRIMRSRARATPARDAAGNPTTDTLTGRVRWVLPDEVTPPPTEVITPPSQ